MRLALFHAAPDTGNLGVTALCYATLYGLITHHPDCEITVFDHGRGRRKQRLKIGDRDITCYFQGAIHSRRFYRPENIRLWPLWARLGGFGNSGLNTIQSADAILDITGGDSFTDLYGPERFKSVMLPKQIALQQKKPLILLPQTYGPFKSEKNRRAAAQIVSGTRSAWARDGRSFEVLKNLLGDAFDPSKHKCGVDVAFALPSRSPWDLSPQLNDFLEDTCTEIVGINISGLLYNNPQKARALFGIKADYNQVVVELVRRFLRETHARIALVPHVVTPQGHYESDLDACHDVMNRIGEEAKERVVLVPAFDNPCEIKWVISKFAWFCGTRMHATIAALSSGVPVSAISYSPKTLGVFEACNQGAHVADPVIMENVQLLDVIWQSWIDRNVALKTYSAILPGIRSQVFGQFKALLGTSSCQGITEDALKL